MRTPSASAAAIAAPLFAFATAALAAPFVPGNAVVYRVGSGSGALVTTGSPVFLDEYTAAGVKVQTVALPQAASSPAQRALVASGTASTDGLLTRSADGSCLAV